MGQAELTLELLGWDNGMSDSFSFSFIHSFILQVFMKHLLCKSGTVLSAGERATKTNDLPALGVSLLSRKGKHYTVMRQGECNGPENVRCLRGTKQRPAQYMAQRSPPKERTSAAR